MKLTKVTVTERTESHILFTIEVESKTLWGKVKISQYKCSIKLGKHENPRLLNTGEKLWSKLGFYIDDALEAILSSKNDTWSAI